MNQRKTNWYNLGGSEVVRLLHTDRVKGLDWDEAKKRLRKYGFNQLEEKRTISPFALLLNQFKDFMVLVLLAATLISGLLGEYMDAITIIIIVVLNAILGFIQEFRAEQSLRALRELTAPNARVQRAGVTAEIPAKEVVPGDIVQFAEGDRIPADVRILKAVRLQVEESALTGESVPVFKEEEAIVQDNPVLGEQKNMAFMGTLATQGSGIGVVVATGMDTEMGRIADLLQSTESMETPLQRRLEQLGKILVLVAVGLTLVVVAAGIWHGQQPYQMFLAGVSLAVAAIPEGLPAIVTIVLAIGVQRMIRRKAIVRKLPSVETLGCATVICSDKTGTLTQNKMTVAEIWADSVTVQVTGSGYEPQGDFVENGRKKQVAENTGLHKVLLFASLCNNAKLLQEKQKGSLLRKSNAQSNWVVHGDPTEGALLVAAGKAGIQQEQLQNRWKRVDEYPFDSTRKMMSIIAESNKGDRVVIVKGAPDVLLGRCEWVFDRGQKIRLTPTLRNNIINRNNDMASKALRNLAIAYRDMEKNETIKDEKQAERGLIFLGLMGMFDPPRPEVKEAIRQCREAGIKTVMITGDHQLTAEAIAGQLGIIPPGGLTVNAQDLYNMSSNELLEKADNIYVYARVSPEHKLHIVKALQTRGHVVAMTGDGVNDAPAIKAADIGIAMGISGTDVSKEASDLVLSDDNFATIKAAIEEGRSIYDNIRKFIRYLLASNVGEILVMFFAMMAGLPLPLVPIQILWVNLVTDGLPAMALGVDQPEEETMHRPPRSHKESIFARGLGWKIISRGFLIGMSTLAAFWLSYQAMPDDLVKAQTMAFTTLVMAQLIHVFDCRSERSVFHRNVFENKWLVLAVVSSIVLMLGVIYWEPMQPIFKTVPLDTGEWIYVMFFAAIPTFLAGTLRLIGERIFTPKHIQSKGTGKQGRAWNL